SRVVPATGAPSPSPSQAPSKAPGPRAAPLKLTASIDPASGYTVISSGVIGATQQFVLRVFTAGVAAKTNATVVVYEPGDFDLAPYRRGQKTSVQGRDAYYFDDTSLPHPTPASGRPEPIRGPRLAWQTPTGQWAVVQDVLGRPDDPVAALVAVAETVRFGPARDIALPFRLSFVPPGVTPQVVRLEDGINVLGFTAGDPGLDPDGMLLGAELKASAMQVSASKRSGYVDAHNAGDRPPVRLGNADTWYFEPGERGLFMVPPHGGLILAQTPTCAVTVTVDDTSRVPRAVLEQVVAGLDIKDCADPGTWTAPLP
ncbi:MAG: hypothetical protein HOU01_07870, partial [Streptomycetaceae bacterium]|nr:hypothetical protein [Streptomycetaceae bacterium]